MTVNATDADDGINVNNGIIGYSILSEEPRSAQQMFTIDPEKGVISVIGTGLDREVGALAASRGPRGSSAVGLAVGSRGCQSPRVRLVRGLATPGSLSLLRGCLQPQAHLGSALGMLQGRPWRRGPRWSPSLP